MTTTVTVSAHCDSEKTKVEVQILDGEQDGQNIYLEDGEAQDFHAYDRREIIVKEVDK